MNRWNHNICRACWDRKEPFREPTRLLAELYGEQRCCYCGEPNSDGIFVKTDPDSPALVCRGDHADQAVRP